jgi:glycosyltransferase involved in cell wall biosynthesis
MNAALAFTLLVLFISLGLFLRLRNGMRQLQLLGGFSPILPDSAPRVSIIFSALNEASTIEPALRSMLALDYPDLEIIAINDRSNDATGAILDRLGQEHPILRVLHIRELPSGWLGKNHALQKGGELATGDYLLFTDADVIFDRNALRRAVGYAQREQLDHLVVWAEYIVRSHFLAMVMLTSIMAFFTRFMPWKVRTSPKLYLGMGAFNMVRATSYRKAGGHVPLALEVVDDIGLGKLMKKSGFKQDVLLGRGTVSVEWYRNTREWISGIEKNAFAMIDFSLWKCGMLGAVALTISCWPWIGLFVTHNVSWWLNLTTLAIRLATLDDLRRPRGWNPRCLFYWPLFPAVTLFVFLRAIVLIIVRDGINWRGTHYSLSELKQGQI